LLIEINAKLKM